MLPDVLYALPEEGAGLMGTFVPTPEQREIMERLQRDIAEWVHRAVTGNDVEHILALQRRCEEMNERPLQDRLRVLSDMFGADYSGTVESVADVKWHARAGTPEEGCVYAIDTEVQMRRNIEEVYFTVVVAPKAPIIDGDVMRCPAENCTWHWELRREEADRERDLRLGREMYLLHHRDDHPLNLDDLDKIEPVAEFRINHFYSDGGSVRVQDLEAQVTALTEKVNELVEVVNEHTKELR